MSRFRFSRWLAGLSCLLAVVLIAAGSASAQTTLWDFAALLGNTGPCQDLGGTEAVAQTGFGTIDLVAELGGTLLTVKGGNLPVGDSERGLGLAQGSPCNGDEVGDGGAGTLLMSFSNVLPAGSTVTEVQLGSLQSGECYRLSISQDGGTTFGAASQVCPATEVVTVPIGLPTAGLVLKFEKALTGTGDNDYVVNSATTNFVPPVGICHNIGGPRELGANCDAPSGSTPPATCTVQLVEGPLVLTENQFLGIIVPFNTTSGGALAAHIKHGDGPIVGEPFDPPLHLASTGQIHKASNVECLGERVNPQPPEPGN
jgi:hypothetical protein